MTAEEAIRILNPEHRETYSSLEDLYRNQEKINMACQMGAKAISLLSDYKLYYCYRYIQSDNYGELHSSPDIIVGLDSAAKWVASVIQDRLSKGFELSRETPISIDSIKANLLSKNCEWKLNISLPDKQVNYYNIVVNETDIDTALQV